MHLLDKKKSLNVDFYFKFNTDSTKCIVSKIQGVTEPIDELNRAFSLR